jgi:hypothetical protein
MIAEPVPALLCAPTGLNQAIYTSAEIEKVMYAWRAAAESHLGIYRQIMN